MVQVPCQNSFGKTVVSLTPSPLCTNGSQKYLKILKRKRKYPGLVFGRLIFMLPYIRVLSVAHLLIKKQI